MCQHGVSGGRLRKVTLLVLTLLLLLLCFVMLWLPVVTKKSLCLVGFAVVTEGIYTDQYFLLLFFIFLGVWNFITVFWMLGFWTHKHTHSVPLHLQLPCAETLTLIYSMTLAYFSDPCSSLPGCSYDLEVREVRDSSLVLLWAAPLYEGRSPVTGYLLEISQGDQSDSWTALNEKPISDTHYKVSVVVKASVQDNRKIKRYNILIYLKFFHDLYLGFVHYLI